jgi:MYXO-CTERM domain-containing protein
LPDGRVIIIEKDGGSHVRQTDGTLVDSGTFSVNTISEQGLLGVEVDPAFTTTNRLFFYYSADASIGGTNDDRHRVVSMTLKADSTLDFTTEKILVRGLHGPANHDGGSLAIGPDGNLYIGVGDTGCNSNTAPRPPYTPTNFFGTCLSNGNGKILRVALDGTIPSDNPLVGATAVSACGTGGACGAESTDPASIPNTAPRTDIYAWGFRNPWRSWFDPVTGNLWVGDVGEITIEEIDIVQKGKHHGWPWREGTFGWPTNKCQDIVPNAGDCVDPIYDCQHGTDGSYLPDGNCTCMNGGQIIDSCDWPAPWKGLYFFGDCANGRLWTLQPNAARDGIVAGSRKQIGQLGGAVPVSFKNGPDGGLYIAALPGRIVRLSPKSPVTCPPGDSGIDATPPPDGGKTDSGTTHDSSSGGDTSTCCDSATSDGGSGGDTGSSGGCGCTVVGAQNVYAGAFAIAGLAAVAIRRRRRRR